MNFSFLNAVFQPTEEGRLLRLSLGEDPGIGLSKTKTLRYFILTWIDELGDVTDGPKLINKIVLSLGEVSSSRRSIRDVKDQILLELKNLVEEGYISRYEDLG